MVCCPSTQGVILNYWQATDGVCTTRQPGFYDVANRMKWNAWKALGDMSSDEAKRRYIAKLLDDSRKLPDTAESRAFVARIAPPPSPPANGGNTSGTTATLDAATHPAATSTPLAGKRVR